MIPLSHPRHASLMQRHLVEEAVKKGIATPTGMIAQGRGEAFDYLLGEKTHPEAKKAIRAAAARLLLAKYPVLSVNGNTAALCPDEFISLAKLLGAKIEINLFYGNRARKKRIYKLFKKKGFEILGVKTEKKIPNLDSKRGDVSVQGIWKADVVFVPLEDGDRTEALRRMGKRVIAVDLNPKSRTAARADLTIVDNVIRAMPLLEKEVRKLKAKPKSQLRKIVKSHNNKKSLRKITQFMRESV